MVRAAAHLSVLVVATALACAAQQSDLDAFTKKLAPSVGSPENAVDKILEAARLKPGETLYDLGCGDGRILVKRSEEVQSQSRWYRNIEIVSSPKRAAACPSRSEAWSDQVKIIHGDFMKTDLSAANVVTLYLAPSANDTLRPNLERELKPNTRVVSYDYPIEGWNPINTWETSGHLGDVHTIYLYEVPHSIKK